MSRLVEAMELKKEFKGFLEGVQLGLGNVFTKVLWDNNIRSAGVLAAAEPDDLVQHGIDKVVARAIIKKAKDVAAPGGTGITVEYVGSRSEGMRARSSLFSTGRNSTVANVLTLVQQCGAVLIKAPPQSGKTSLLQLLHKEAVTRTFSAVAFVSMADAIKGETFLDLLKKKHPSTWEHLWGTSPHVSQAGDAGQGKTPVPGKRLLLVDEAQLLYNKGDDDFWRKLKVVQQAGEEQQLLIIMAAMYGNLPSGLGTSSSSPEPTPVQFDREAQITLASSPGQPSLALTPLEFEELIDSFNKCVGGNQDALHDEAALEHLFELTGGQVGMIVVVLDIIHSKVRNAQLEQGLLDRVAGHVLRSKDLYQALRDQRSMMVMDALEGYKDLLTRVMEGASCEGLEAEAAKLVRHGLLSESEGQTKFTSPLHEQYYLVQLYQGAKRMLQDCSTDFELFLQMSIQRMSASTLSQSLSKGRSPRSRVYERHLQMEWYRSAVSYVPSSVLIAPDVGSVFGSSGYVDFWVSIDEDRGWAIELLCDGDRANEHAARFTAEGRYASLPMTRYALIDFRQGATYVRVRKPGFHYVIFSKDFSTAQIMKETSVVIVQLAK